MVASWSSSGCRPWGSAVTEGEREGIRERKRVSERKLENKRYKEKERDKERSPKGARVGQWHVGAAMRIGDRPAVGWCSRPREIERGRCRE